ncbi:MAG: aspartyl protease family protein [Gemmatimonadota bacterium]
MIRSLEMAVVCSVLLTLTLSCGDRSTAPLTDVPAPLDEIVDAAHGGGNQDFFFLPPLVPDPSGNAAFDADAFDASLAPVVEVCALDADGCAATQPDMFPLTYTMSDGPGSETVRLDAEAENYIVNWHTDDFGLDPDVTYRIHVRVAGTELGHADVDVAESGGALRNINTNEYVPLKDGRTLPIKFRVEQGAVYVVDADGGTVVAEDGVVTLVVPGQGSTVGITVQPATGYPDTTALVAGTAFDLGPEGTTFDPPATLTIQYDPANLPPNTVPRLHHLVNGEWTRVPGATADLAAHTVTGPVTGFSPWAVLGTGPVLSVNITGGQGQVVVQGSTLNPCRYDDTVLPCAADFTLNQTLTLEAQTLGPDAQFEGWSGSGAPSTCTTDRVCSITMDQDRAITATFSMPGLVGLSTYDTTLTAAQGGTGASAQIVVSNIGGRDLNLEPVQVYNDQDVPHWLDASITSQTVTTASPETLTVSVAANALPPGTYGAHVLVTDGYFSGVLAVTLDVTATTSYTYDGTGNQFGPRPLSIAIFTNAAGTDIYPVGSGEEYLFVLFDTGSSIVYLSSADATFLNIGATSSTNVNQDTRVRLDGLSAIDPTALTAPIAAHGTAGGAQAEVTGIRVGPASPPQRPDLGASLIGAPVANEVLALIDNTTTVSRGPYPFCGGCYAEGPDITFYMPTDAGIPVPDLQLPLERFGSTSPALLDNATNGQKYFVNQVLFRNAGHAVMHDPAATQPFRFWFDTGAPETIIDTRLATALGIDLSAAGSFDCFTGLGKAGNEGYVIDQIAFSGTTTGGVGAYVINHAEVCVDIRSEELRQYYTPSGSGTPVLVDAQIGANLFMYVPILFDGHGNQLGIVVP